MIIDLVDITGRPSRNLVKTVDAQTVENTVQLGSDAFDLQEIIGFADRCRNTDRSQGKRPGTDRRSRSDWRR